MFIDIAANLTDDMFQGTYHEKKRHESDLELVIERAKNAHCDKMIVLAGTLEDAHKCLEICNTFDPAGGCLYTTVGFHPTRCGEAAKIVGDASDEEAEKIIHEIFRQFIEKAGKGRVVAIGEFGLDYDRLNFCPIEVQKRFFEIQLRVATNHFPDHPLLLHLRNAFDDFVDIISKHNVQGVVHSFTGSNTEMRKLVDLGLYIGINGCSLRDAWDVVPHIPEDRLIIETDSPYCEIKPTHPAHPFLSGPEIPERVKPEKFVLGSFVKSRNEPACINQVAFALAKVRRVDFGSLSATIRANTIRLFRALAK
jgi:TatD DNase family protein